MARYCDWSCGGGGVGGGMGMGGAGPETEGALHSVAFALGQMQDCMRSMRCKMDRTDKAVRCVAQRLKVQRRIIQKVDRRIDVLEQGPSCHLLAPGGCAAPSSCGACAGQHVGSGHCPPGPAQPPAFFPCPAPSASNFAYSRCSSFSPPPPPCAGHAAGFGCPRRPRAFSCRPPPPRCGRRRRSCRSPGLTSCSWTHSSGCVCPSSPSSTDSMCDPSLPDLCNSPVSSNSPCPGTAPCPGPCPGVYPCSPPRSPARCGHLARRSSPVHSRSLQVCGSTPEPPPEDGCEPYLSLPCLGKRLIKAAQKGNLKKVRRLLERGADVNFEASGKWTPLHRAAAKAHSGVVELLLSAGANANARNIYGFTALHIAAYDDFRGKCLQLLIDNGADTGSRNRFGRTPLHYAAECGNMAAVKVLLRAGANKTSKDDDGRTPLDVTRTICIRRLLRPVYRRKKHGRSCSPKKCCCVEGQCVCEM